jgi:GDPmannose 4,6-dehydratase
MKKALITGITGQDGAYLASFLLEKGYTVFGTYRRSSTPNFWRLHSLDVFDKVKLIPVDLIDSGSIIEAIRISEPDELYNLAAQSFVAASFQQPVATAEVTGLGVTRILEAIRLVSPHTRYYQASTSELYGNGSYEAYTEITKFQPSSPYAAAKLYAYWLTKIYREGYGIFATNGILFNHESPLRGLEFVTRKISNAAAKIKLGLETEIELGNLDAKRDWGYAPEYVETMWLMLQQEHPDDFVIATNESHSVSEFAQLAFEVVGLDWRDHVRSVSKFQRPVDVNSLRGDYSKAQWALGWQPNVKFNELGRLMGEEDLNRWTRWLAGERFYWDAPMYSSETNIMSRALGV